MRAINTLGRVGETNVREGSWKSQEIFKLQKL